MLKHWIVLHTFGHCFSYILMQQHCVYKYGDYSSFTKLEASVLHIRNGCEAVFFPLHYRHAEILILALKRAFLFHSFNCQEVHIYPTGRLFQTSLILTPLTVTSISKTFFTLDSSLSLHGKDVSSFADLENFIKAIVCPRVDYCNALFTTYPLSTVIYIPLFKVEALNESENVITSLQSYSLPAAASL